MRLGWVVLCASVMVVGCSQKQAVDAYQPPSAKISRDASFYVMRPQDGSYRGKSYAGSGQSTTTAVVTALYAFTTKVVPASAVEDLQTATANAKAAGLSYVFEPTILNWEDRATEWSGKTDKITVRFIVHDIAKGSVVASTVARASSPWGTFGGDHPQDLLPLPTSTFVNGLF